MQPAARADSTASVTQIPPGLPDTFPKLLKHNADILREAQKLSGMADAIFERHKLAGSRPG